HLEFGRDQYLQGARLTWDMRWSRLVSEVIATRGDRLMLQRTCHEVADTDVGPSEREYLVLIEADEHGNHRAMVLYDAGDIDAAYAELDRRYLAGEGRPYAREWEAGGQLWQTIVARDWAGLAALMTPDCVFADHRPLGAGTLPRDEYVALVRAMVEL